SSSRENRLEPLATELAEVDEGGQLLAGPAVELAERTGERRLAEDGHDEHVGLDVPRLIGGDAYLHEDPLGRGGGRLGCPRGECTARGRTGQGNGIPVSPGDGITPGAGVAWGSGDAAGAAVSVGAPGASGWLPASARASSIRPFASSIARTAWVSPPRAASATMTMIVRRSGGSCSNASRR